ncbi:MAG: glycosyltransferase family 39 protein [Candidatus Moranbacteria bacterium]|nr:glycosyltransferase family 39 protein [Candidatus Moranbacteria bacterium]
MINKDKIFLKLKNIPWIWWILAGIIVMGIFLRTWHFHDWLRFNADQGRDAIVISDAVDGKGAWPLLGPKAGGTQFRLGPAFYWIGITSAKIFGNAPEKMAYPDLFASILAIPLLFFFLEKYFGKKTALSLTAVFSVSAYAIFYSRFAWNPNSLPFWTLLALYALNEVFSEKSNRKYLWAALAGAAIGIDVQLHTTMLVVFPITVLVLFAYFIFRNKKYAKYFLVIVAVALFFNIPQILNEHQTGGKNTSAFFKGLKTKSAVEETASENALRGGNCLIQSSVYMISGYEISDTCNFSPGENRADTVVFFSGLLFVVGGIFLGGKKFLVEKGEEKRVFLGIIAIFLAVTLVVFWKMAQELSVRFYLPLIFFPFLLLGLWFDFLKEKFKFFRKYAIIFIFLLLLVVSNLYFAQKYFMAFADYGRPGGGSVEVMTLKEIEIFSRFIAENSKGEEKAYIDGNQQFLHKAYTPLKYLVGRSGVKLSLLRKASAPPARYFDVVSLKKFEKSSAGSGERILGHADYGNFVIMFVEKI